MYVVKTKQEVGCDHHVRVCVRLFRNQVCCILSLFSWDNSLSRRVKEGAWVRFLFSFKKWNKVTVLESRMYWAKATPPQKKKKRKKEEEEEEGEERRRRRRKHGSYNCIVQRASRRDVAVRQARRRRRHGIALDLDYAVLSTRAITQSCWIEWSREWRRSLQTIQWSTNDCNIYIYV